MKGQRKLLAALAALVLLLATGLGCNLTTFLQGEETPTVPPSPAVEGMPTPTGAPMSPPQGGMVPLDHPFAGVNMEYPSGWVVEFQQVGMVLAESQEVLDSDSFSTGSVMIFLSGPAEEMVLNMGAEATAEGLLDVVLEDFGGGEEDRMGEIETRQFAEQEGVGVPLWWTEDGQALQGYLAAYLDEEVGAVLLAVSPEGDWDSAWPLFDAMMGSMLFYAPQESVERGGIEQGGVSTATIDPGGTDVWIYQSPGDEYVTIEVTALEDWDPTLEVLNEAGDSVAFDDDSGGDYNPRLTGLYLIAPGRYEIQVAAYSGHGEYQIGMSEAEAPGGGSIVYGATVESALELGEREVWTFEGTAGDIVNISMVGVGELTNTYLELYGPDGTLLIEDDDSGEEYFALIEAYELPESGMYRIVAQGFGGGLGTYELSLEKGP